MGTQNCRNRIVQNLLQIYKTLFVALTNFCMFYYFSTKLSIFRLVISVKVTTLCKHNR